MTFLPPPPPPEKAANLFAQSPFGPRVAAAEVLSSERSLEVWDRVNSLSAIPLGLLLGWLTYVGSTDPLALNSVGAFQFFLAGLTGGAALFAFTTALMVRAAKRRRRLLDRAVVQLLMQRDSEETRHAER